MVSPSVQDWMVHWPEMQDCPRGQSALTVQVGLILLVTQRAVVKSQRIETGQSASLLHVVRNVGGVQTQAGNSTENTSKKQKVPYTNGRRIIQTSDRLKAYKGEHTGNCVCGGAREKKRQQKTRKAPRQDRIGEGASAVNR